MARTGDLRGRLRSLRPLLGRPKTELGSAPLNTGGLLLVSIRTRHELGFARVVDPSSLARSKFRMAVILVLRNWIVAAGARKLLTMSVDQGARELSAHGEAQADLVLAARPVGARSRGN